MYSGNVVKQPHDVYNFVKLLWEVKGKWNLNSAMATSKAVQLQFSQNPKQKSVTTDRLMILIEPQKLVSLWSLERGRGE